jgi:type IV pilus assembly protein PilM
MAATLIGLDVGASSVRAIEAVRSRPGEVSLKRFGQFALPVGAVRAGVVHDPAAVASALRSLWKQSGFGSKRVAVSATNAQVAVREVTMPVMPAKELRQALPYLARDIIPIPVDRAQLDFIPTGPADDTGKQPGLLVALPSDGVVGLVDAVERAGLIVDSVDLGAFALLRALAAHPHDDDGATATATAIIDLGATSATLVVQRRGVPLMVRTVPHGGDEVTGSLSERLGISRPEAEEQKRSAGLDTESVAAEVSRGAVRPLIAEIHSSLAYYASTQPNLPVSAIALTGGGALLSGLPALIALQEGLPVSMADPLQLLASVPDAADIDLFRAGSANAAGLILGGTHDSRAFNSAAPAEAAGEPAAGLRQLGFDPGEPVAAAHPGIAPGEADQNGGVGRNDLRGARRRARRGGDDLR